MRYLGTIIGTRRINKIITITSEKKVKWEKRRWSGYLFQMDNVKLERWYGKLEKVGKNLF